MRFALCTAALCLLAFPALAESHCAGSGPDNQVIAAVSVPGDFRSCLTKLMQGARASCAPGAAEVVLTVTGTENGKEADMRVLRIDCPGAKVSRGVPPGMSPPPKPAEAPPAKGEAPQAKGKKDASSPKK